MDFSSAILKGGIIGGGLGGDPISSSILTLLPLLVVLIILVTLAKAISDKGI